MKKFRYRWRMSGRELTGSKNAEDAAVLRAHIQKLGGELVEILGEEELPVEALKIEEAPQRESAAPAATPAPPPAAAIEEPPPGVRKILNDPPLWLNVIWCWGTILTGVIALLICVLMIISSMLAGLGWLGDLPVWSKIALLAGAALLSGVILATGIAGLSHPRLTAFILLGFASFDLFWVILNCAWGNFRVLSSALVPGVILWLLLRKK